MSEMPLLRDLLVEEIIKAIGWRQSRWVARFIQALFGQAARRFAELGAQFDHLVTERGFAEAARWALPVFVEGFVAQGTELIPAEGPLIIAANHPGVVDSLLVASCVGRRDLKIVAGAIPFLQRLPHVSRHLIYAPANDLGARVNVVRAAIRHLLQGGALLSFARGQIEPDPAVMPEADAEFGCWSRSLDILLSRVPQARVLVAIVSGVIARESLRHPFTWFGKTRVERQKLAMFIQVIRQMMGKRLALVPRVTFGEPPVTDVAGDRSALFQTIIGTARRLLALHLSQEVEG